LGCGRYLVRPGEDSQAFIVRPSGDLTPRGVVPDIAIETPVVEGVNDPVLERARLVAGSCSTSR